MNREDIRQEFNVNVIREDLGMEISLCGFCGNCGIIDTRKSAKWNGEEVGLIGYCICANGRAYKKSHPNLLVKDMEQKIENQNRKIFQMLGSK